MHVRKYSTSLVNGVMEILCTTSHALNISSVYKLEKTVDKYIQREKNVYYYQEIKVVPLLWKQKKQSWSLNDEQLLIWSFMHKN